MKAIESFKSNGTTRVLGAPFFPYDGCTLFIETEGDKNHIESFVKNDPYVKQGFVSDYEIMEFDIQSRKKFDRISGDFVYRS